MLEGGKVRSGMRVDVLISVGGYSNPPWLYLLDAHLGTPCPPRCRYAGLFLPPVVTRICVKMVG